MSSKEDNTNLYRVLERGDRRIVLAHESAMLLVGLTRAGKSTTFNWILGKHLIGVGDEVDAHYQNVVDQDKEAAELGDSYTSVTLCPNIVQYDKEKKITLIDMAGYKDKRDFIGVLGVSYFLKAVFEKVKNVKFLLVLGEDKLMQNSGDGVISTFTGFLNMFSIQNMTPQIKKQFYESICLCVTRSQNVVKHLGYLRRISKQLKDPKLITQKKQELVSLIDFIIEENRIQPFSAAVTNTNAPKCEIVNQLNNMGWEFFNISEAERSIKKEFVHLPFKKDYEDLKEDQKKGVDSVIAARVRSYLQFSKILNTLVRSVQQNWNNCINKWTTQGEFQLNLTNYQNLFQRIRQFLQENDFYNSAQLLIPDIKVEYGTSLNLVKTINKILQLYSISDAIGDQTDSFIPNMNAYTILFQKLIQCMFSFASSQEHERLLLRLSFIIKRGFRQFSMLYHINPNAIHDVSQKMKDNCNLIFDQKRKEFIQKFITHVDDKLMPKLFTKAEDLLQYEEFFNKYEDQFRKEYQQFSFFNEQRNNFQIAKATIYIKDNKKKKAVRCYIRAFKSVCQIASQIQKSSKPQNQIDNELNQLYLKKLSMIGVISSLLITFKDVPQAKNYALTLSTYTKNIYQACQIYDLIIEETENLKEKLEKIGEYADYCLEWGRFEKATTLLQKKLFFERESFGQFNNTIKKLINVSSKQNEYLASYQIKLEGWIRIPQQDTQLNSYLDDIEYFISDF